MQKGGKMGVPTKVQMIKRKNSNQWYVNFPAQVAQALDLRQSEVMEWHIVDKATLILMRKEVSPSVLKKNGERAPPGNRKDNRNNPARVQTGADSGACPAHGSLPVGLPGPAHRDRSDLRFGKAV
jgi:hypothetical protein